MVKSQIGSNLQSYTARTDATTFMETNRYPPSHRQVAEQTSWLFTWPLLTLRHVTRSLWTELDKFSFQRLSKLPRVQQQLTVVVCRSNTLRPLLLLSNELEDDLRSQEHYKNARRVDQGKKVIKFVSKNKTSPPNSINLAIFRSFLNISNGTNRVE